MSHEPCFSSIRWADLDLLLGPQTFLPRESSLGLLEFTRALPLWRDESCPAALVDMCCGSGALGIALYLSAPRPIRSLLLLDASADAIRSASANISFHGVSGRAVLWEAGDPLPLNEPALIICNPPFLSSESAQGLPAWEEKCVASAEGGLAVVKRCFESIAGSRHVMVLKSLTSQIPRIAALEANEHRLAADSPSGTPDVAFSFWVPARRSAQRRAEVPS